MKPARFDDQQIYASIAAQYRREQAMKDPTYAPMYAALYPGLAKITRAHGYALAVHGTLGRDMDLVCIPWTERPSDSAQVVAAIIKEFHIRTIGEPDTTHHGRERWTISVGFGECFLDLSFMPRTTPNAALSGAEGVRSKA